jgi:hypothetical protein
VCDYSVAFVALSSRFVVARIPSHQGIPGLDAQKADANQRVMGHSESYILSSCASSVNRPIFINFRLAVIAYTLRLEPGDDRRRSGAGESLCSFWTATRLRMGPWIAVLADHLLCHAHFGTLTARPGSGPIFE